MKRTFTQPPVKPEGWTGKDFNQWINEMTYHWDLMKGIKPKQNESLAVSTRK